MIVIVTGIATSCGLFKKTVETTETQKEAEFQSSKLDERIKDLQEYYRERSKNQNTTIRNTPGTALFLPIDCDEDSLLNVVEQLSLEIAGLKITREKGGYRITQEERRDTIRNETTQTDSTSNNRQREETVAKSDTTSTTSDTSAISIEYKTNWRVTIWVGLICLIVGAILYAILRRYIPILP